MKAKYVKKQWYQDPNGGAAPESHASSHSPTASNSYSNAGGSGNALTVPDRIRTSTRSPSTDNLNMSPSSTAPERTLSRKSSNISSDSGSVTQGGSASFYSESATFSSKSTNLSSTAPSPFNGTGSRTPNQHPQHNAQGSFDDFARMMNGGGQENNLQNPNSSFLGTQAIVTTPSAMDNSDPFSLMTSAFNRMGMDSQYQSSNMPPNMSNNMPTMISNGAATLSIQSSSYQQPSIPTSSEFFSSFSTGAGPASTSGNIDGSDPFSLAPPRSMMQHQQQPHLLSTNSLYGLDFTSSGSTSPIGVTSGSKSFDDYLQTLGGRGPSQPSQAYQAPGSFGLSTGALYSSVPSLSSSSGPSSVTASLSPQSTGGSNPFGKQQPMSPQKETYITDYPQPAAAAPSSTSGQQSNPFALFAKQTVAPNPMNAALTDPFGRGMAMASQPQQQLDYFSASRATSSGTRSPNPFGMGAGAQMAPSPFEQQQQQQLQPSFMRSASESSYTYQNAFGGGGNSSHMNGNVNGNSFESAFSVPGAPPRSMTLPASTGNPSMNDMFGQWIKPSPLPASSKYPSIDGLDPFSTSAAAFSNTSSSSTMPTGTSTASAFSNPFH
ncbi:hypothetical protein B0O80DRAFT_18377 [Mortierella sp. GBAus27b]|nr:hypothetical protein B0O80DRAFT_18377 [Mortierella sp. GBAus27b]